MVNSETTKGLHKTFNHNDFSPTYWTKQLLNSKICWSQNNKNLWSVLFTRFLSFRHSFRKDGGVYDEARSQKQTKAGENTYI